MRKRIETDDARMDREVKAVVKLIRLDFAGAADFTANDDGTFDILDRRGRTIGTVTEPQMTRYWNMMEGG